MPTHSSLGYFGPDFDSIQAYTVTMRYIILSSPRTGSNYVCARLANFRDTLGTPMEYFHPDAISEVMARASVGKITAAADPAPGINLTQYMETLMRLRSTPDGCFGLKVQPSQLSRLVGNNLGMAAEFLRRRFDKLIILLCKDKLSQAVSGVIAEATGRWFNFGEEAAL